MFDFSIAANIPEVVKGLDHFTMIRPSGGTPHPRHWETLDDLGD